MLSSGGRRHRGGLTATLEIGRGAVKLVSGGICRQEYAQTRMDCRLYSTIQRGVISLHSVIPAYGCRQRPRVQLMAQWGLLETWIGVNIQRLTRAPHCAYV